MSFPVNFAKFLRTPFFTEHLRWLLLNCAKALRKRTSKFHKISRERQMRELLTNTLSNTYLQGN